MTGSLKTCRTDRESLITVLFVMAILFIPWLGEMYFYSKGEPREAIVAVSMLESGNWILPLSYGGDIPYKPPFLAWLISLFSIIFNHGAVSEFTSRLPSALASIALLLATWRIVASKIGKDSAWFTTFILATAFEFFRATVACRVDMVLTACTVGAIYAMYTMEGKPWRVFYAILLLTGATLTKGPVGSLLPCLVMGIYMLVRKKNFSVTVGKLSLIALASFILPAIWYWLAYRQGGEGFAALAWEENIGRLTSSMGYASHVNPWYYNFVSIIAGMLPWTLPVVAVLFIGRVRKTLKIWFRDAKNSFSVLSIIAVSTIVIFYCIPESKRSVYLLPCYPFLAYGTARILELDCVRTVLRYWCKVLAVIGIVVPVALTVSGFLDTGIITVERMSWYQTVIAAFTVSGCLWWLVTRTKDSNFVAGACALTYILMLFYNACAAPAIMNPKSDYAVAGKIKEMVPDDAKIVTWIESDSLMRYYTLNFYLDDRLRLFTGNEDDALLLTGLEEVGDTVGKILLTVKSCDTRKPIYLIDNQSLIQILRKKTSAEN